MTDHRGIYGKEITKDVFLGFDGDLTKSYEYRIRGSPAFLISFFFVEGNLNNDIQITRNTKLVELRRSEERSPCPIDEPCIEIMSPEINESDASI